MDYTRDQMINPNRTEVMNMDKIPTPETDAVEKAFTSDSGQNPQHRLTLKSRNLERRLTVAREALLLALHVRGTSDDNEEVRNRMELALTQTAPKL